MLGWINTPVSKESCQIRNMGWDNVSLYLHWIRILEGKPPSGVYEYRSSYLMASEISLTENCILSSSLTGTGFNPARLSSIWASFGSHNFSSKTNCFKCVERKGIDFVLFFLQFLIYHLLYMDYHYHCNKIIPM